jgi:hypothetical protein
MLHTQPQRHFRRSPDGCEPSSKSHRMSLNALAARDDFDLFDFQNYDGRFDWMRPGRAQDGSKTIKRIQSILVTLYVLELVGATAVTSLGWSAPGGSISESIRDRSGGRRPIFIATPWAGFSWLFYRIARSTRMTQIWVLRSRLEKQPTDLAAARQYTSYSGTGH